MCRWMETEDRSIGGGSVGRREWGFSQSIPNASYRRLQGAGPKLAHDGVGGGLVSARFKGDILACNSVRNGASLTVV